MYVTYLIASNSVRENKAEFSGGVPPRMTVQGWVDRATLRISVYYQENSVRICETRGI